MKIVLLYFGSIHGMICTIQEEMFYGKILKIYICQNVTFNHLTICTSYL